MKPIHVRKKQVVTEQPAPASPERAEKRQSDGISKPLSEKWSSVDVKLCIDNGYPVVQTPGRLRVHLDGKDIGFVWADSGDEHGVFQLAERLADRVYSQRPQKGFDGDFHDVVISSGPTRVSYKTKLQTGYAHQKANSALTRLALGGEHFEGGRTAQEGVYPLAQLLNKAAGLFSPASFDQVEIAFIDDGDKADGPMVVHRATFSKDQMHAALIGEDPWKLPSPTSRIILDVKDADPKPVT